MASVEQFKQAFEAASDRNIVVSTRSGKQYWLHEDQLAYIEGGYMVYGYALKPHPRAKRDYEWFDPRNLEIVEPANA